MYYFINVLEIFQSLKLTFLFFSSQDFDVFIKSREFTVSIVQ